MTATTTEVDQNYATLVPARGTLPMAADTLILKGTIVTSDGAGLAGPGVLSTDAAVGVSSATFDNRTGAPSGGGDGDLDVEVQYGVFGFAIDGADPVPGAILYVVDNQTVSASSAGLTRGVAGVCTEVRDIVGGATKAFLWMGPHVNALLKTPA